MRWDAGWQDTAVIGWLVAAMALHDLWNNAWIYSDLALLLLPLMLLIGLFFIRYRLIWKTAR